MRLLTIPCILLSAALTLAACEPDEEELLSTVSGLYQLGGTQGSGYFSLPFPNELRRTSTGTVDMGNLADERSDLLKIYFVEMAKNPTGGFGLNAAIYFRFDDVIDEACLPADEEASRKPGASVFLVNIDKTSVDYGKRIPVETKFSAKKGEFIGANNLTVLPVPGFVLRPGTMYAALLTDAMCDEIGAPIMAAADFRQILSSAAPAEARLTEAHKTYAPLREFLQDKGLTGIISAAMFRTGKPTEIARLAREVVHGLPAPTADKLELAYDGVNYYEIHGTYKAPNFQSGTVPFMYVKDGGTIKTDASGKPIVAFTEDMRFSLSVPKKGKMPASGWPVVLYAHGTSGSYRTFISNFTAEKLADIKDSTGHDLAQIAVVGIDQNMHGPRGGGLKPELTFFNFQNPAASVHNVVQAGVDNYSLVRMLKGLTATSLKWRPKATKTGTVTFSPALKFDPNKIYFMGHSQGGLTGPVPLAFEPDIKAAVLSAAGGGAVYSLLYKTAPPPAVRVILEMALKEKADRFHPMLSLIQWLLEPADPANYAPLMIKEPAKGKSPVHLLLTEGLVDNYTPNVTTEALAVAAGVPLVGKVLKKVPALELAGLKASGSPVSGNITSQGKSVTGGLVQFNSLPWKSGKSCTQDSDCKDAYCHSSGKCHNDGHFVVFHVAEANRMVSHFFGTMARDGTPVIKQ